RRGRQFESGCPDHTYVTDLFATFASVRLAHLWRIGAFWGFRRLRAATILSTVGFHRRLDRGLHLRAARDCHLPAVGVLLVGRGFRDRYPAPPLAAAQMGSGSESPGPPSVPTTSADPSRLMGTNPGDNGKSRLLTRSDVKAPVLRYSPPGLASIDRTLVHSCHVSVSMCNRLDVNSL